MIRYETTDGRRVTAETREDAERIAASMGTELARQVETPRRRPRPVTWVAWDDLVQEEVTRGDLAAVARACIEGGDTVVPMIAGARGLRAPTTTQMRAFRRAVEEI